MIIHGWSLLSGQNQKLWIEQIPTLFVEWLGGKEIVESCCCHCWIELEMKGGREGEREPHSTLRAARPDKEFEMGEMDFQPLPEGREREKYHTFTSASHLSSISWNACPWSWKSSIKFVNYRYHLSMQGHIQIGTLNGCPQLVIHKQEIKPGC